MTDATPPTRIALLSPYSGANLGDGAIHDAVISGFRAHEPDVELVALTADPVAILRRHGIPGVRIVGMQGPYTAATQLDEAAAGVAQADTESRDEPPTSATPNALQPPKHGPRSATEALKRMPILGTAARRAARLARTAWSRRHEPTHFAHSLRLARSCDLILVCGGGQLDDQWGGAWAHPYTLLRWAVIARLTRTPFAVASVGVGVIRTRLGRAFCRVACARAAYRSYRDAGSKTMLRDWPFTADDPCVPDLALSLPRSEPRTARGTEHVAIAPMVYARLGSWHSESEATYTRYISTLAALSSWLARAGHRVSFFTSNLQDRPALEDLRQRIRAVDGELDESDITELPCGSPCELAAALHSVDLVVASRLHSVILAHWAARPTLALSFERKVDAEMQAVGHERFCADITSAQLAELQERFRALRAEAAELSSGLAASTEERARAVHAQYRDLLELAARRRHASAPANRRHARSGY